MTEPLLAQLTDFGALGLFAAFLVYQHLSMQKRLDGLVEKIQDQDREARQEGAEAEERLRDRYDAVIAKYEDDLREMRQFIRERVEENSRKIDLILVRLAVEENSRTVVQPGRLDIPRGGR